jgi:multiple sugar transport system permease protein
MSDARRTSEAAVSRAGWWFIAPALLLIGAFFFLPVLASFLLSVTDFDIYAVADPANARFVGLRNYRGLVTDPVFWTALRNTF